MIESLPKHPIVHGLVHVACWSGCQNTGIARIVEFNKTRQGYARKRILKPAGCFFVRRKLAEHIGLEGAR